VIAEYPDCPSKKCAENFWGSDTHHRRNGVHKPHNPRRTGGNNKKQLDYKLDEFDKPHRKGRIYEL